MTDLTPLTVSVGAANAALTISPPGNVFPAARTTCTIATDATFQVTPVIDFGSNVAGGIAGIKFTAGSWAGDTETFALSSVYLHIVRFETSIDGATWTTVPWTATYGVSSAALFPTTPVLEAFTGGAATPPNANWRLFLGSGTNIRRDGSGEGDSSVAATNGQSFWTAVFAPDQEAYMQIGSHVIEDTRTVLLQLRVNDPDNANSTRYVLTYTRGAGAAADTGAITRRNQDGTTTSLLAATNLSSKLAIGDWLGFQALGNRLIGWEKHGGGAWASFASYDITYDDVKLVNEGRLAIGTYGQVGKLDSFSGGTSAGGSSIFSVGDSATWLVPITRYLRSTMYLATVGDVIYAGARAPVLTVQLDIQGP